MCAQTEGILEVQVATSDAGGMYQPNNCLSIWVEDNQNTFVKTLMAYAQTYRWTLIQWENSTTGVGEQYNVVDAISGASLTTHDTRICSWDGTNYNLVDMPDGTYRLWMELTDKNEQGNYSWFEFTKGEDTVILAPTDRPSFSNISIKWMPTKYPDCNGTIGGTAYLDDCGICVGGTTGLTPCTDCNGVPNGDAFIDNCGNCVGGNTGELACTADCNGTYNGSAYIDSCGNCVAGTTGEAPCIQDCNGDWGGEAVEAAPPCTLCVGGNTGRVVQDCWDCNYVYAGSAYIDACGNCAGGSTGIQPNEECIDCNGVIYGTSYVDDCGNCIGGLSDLEECTSTSIESLMVDNISVFPNPWSSGILNINLGINFPANVRIYNLSGMEMYASYVNSSLHEIDKTHFSSGLYTVSISTDDKVLMFKLLIN